MKKRAVFLDAYTLNPGDNNLDELNQYIDLEIYGHSEGDQILERSRGKEILIVNKVVVSGALLKQLPELKFIQVAATGYNNIDLDAARDLGVVVSNISGYSTSSVAQHVFAMLLSYLNSTERYNAEVRAGAWSKCRDFSYWHQPILELSGKTIGLLGYGSIAQAVSRIALAFGMRVLCSTRTIPNDGNDVVFVEPSEMVANSDFVSLHAPLTEATFEFINADMLSKMKKEAVLINTARGQLIDEQALFRALKDGDIAAALLDVMVNEPPAIDNVLLSLDNCYITPHQAWASLEARQRLVGLMIESLEAYIKGEPINQVN